MQRNNPIRSQPTYTTLMSMALPLLLAVAWIEHKLSAQRESAEPSERHP